MADLLGEVDTNIIPSHSQIKMAIKSETRRKVRILSPAPSHTASSKRKMGDTTAPAQTSNAELDSDDGGRRDQGDDCDIPMSDPLPSSPVANAVERKTSASVKITNDGIEDDELMAITEPVED